MNKEQLNGGLHTNETEFLAAIAFTSGETGFRSELIEKDYYLSLVLAHLYAQETCPLIFRGGTCLNKIYVGFYRLSEDLDFLIPASPDLSRTERKKLAAPLKRMVQSLAAQVQGLEIAVPLTGHNDSRQYNAEMRYRSLITGSSGRIALEIGLREPLLEKATPVDAATLLKDPFTGAAVFPGVRVLSLTKAEAFSEKTRAALSRREPAIRDFFDLDYALRSAHIDPKDRKFQSMVQKKLAVPGTGHVDLSETRLRALQTQINTQLRPVLRDQDFASFDLARVFTQIQGFQKSLELLKDFRRKPR